MKTLTVIRIEYHGAELLIPIIEENTDNMEYTSIVLEELKKSSIYSKIKTANWGYIENDEAVREFNTMFFKENDRRRIKYLTINEQDHGNIRSIIFGDDVIQLPFERQYRIPVILKEGDHGLLVDDIVLLPLLTINLNATNG